MIVERTYLSNSCNSRLSGKKSRGSRTARMPRAARYRKASPSSNSTSQIRAHASKGRWFRKSGSSQSGRYAEGEI